LIARHAVGKVRQTIKGRVCVVSQKACFAKTVFDQRAIFLPGIDFKTIGYIARQLGIDFD
jgi:hypothetical protein